MTEDAVLETWDVETSGAETVESGLSDSLTEITFDLLAVLPTLL